MSTKAKTARAGTSSIAVNKKSSHDYFIEQRLEAGIILQGWEVKSLRAKKIQIKDGYVIIKDAEAFLIGAHLSPLPTASTHINPEPTRTRKLLLHKSELNKLIGKVKEDGYTLVPTAMYWRGGLAKLEIGIARGKKLYDKRATTKERDWNRDKERIMKVK